MYLKQKLQVKSLSSTMHTKYSFYFLLTYIIISIVSAGKKSAVEFHIELTIDGINPKFLKTEKIQNSKKNDTVSKRAFPPQIGAKITPIRPKFVYKKQQKSKKNWNIF